MRDCRVPVVYPADFVPTRRNVSNLPCESPIELHHLLGCRFLECLRPLQQLLSLYRRILQTATLKPVEEKLNRGRTIVQLNCSPKLARAEPQGISFGPAPSAPFDNHV